MSATILSVIQHYQKSIEHSQDDEGRLLHCINKLYRLPVKVEHLQETGVGKTVNSLRKYNGEIGVAAKALVTKWKAMVAAEEEPAEVNNSENNDDDNDNDDGKNGSEHGSNEGDHNDKNSHNKHGKSSTTSENITNERQSNNNSHTKKASSEHHKSKSHKEEKSNREHSSSKHKRHNIPDENDVQSDKRFKTDDHDNEHKKRDNHKHKSSHGKSDEKQQSSSRDAKTTSSKHASSQHRNGGGDVTEKKDHSQQRDEKRNDHASSSKQQTSENEEITTRRHGESEKNGSSSKEKDRKERSKESKHDKTKSSSKDSSHRDKHHKSSTSHASNSKPSTTTTTEQPTSSTTNNKPDGSSKRKRHHDSDSNDAPSPSKTKAAKTTKSPKQPMTPPNDNENEVDNHDGIDSSMGANFADVLGMLMMPTKKSKKSLNNNKSPTVSAPSRNISTEKPSSSNSGASKDNKMEYKPSSMSASSSSKSIDTKPELLSSSTKLAPLDPSIALELPTISANYKPLPTNKTVMDCVYRNNGMVNNTPKVSVRTLTDAEAISHGISSKTMRTKIYSGVRTGQMLQVPSLFDLCIRILQKNIDALEYTGGVPFDVLRPVLERATPIQLLTFEEYNPYLMEDSDCLWQIHVQRSFRSKKREEMESWREMFLRCEDEKERKLSSLTETIKKSQKIIAAPIRKTQLAFVDSMVKPPRQVLRKQEQYGTKDKLVSTPAARVASLSIVTPNAAKVGDTRLRVAATVRDTAQTLANPARGKKAPLMAKTLQFIKGRHKR